MKKITYVLLSCAVIFTTLIPKETILDEVRAGNKQAIRQRIENCENCSEKDENGNNALHIAAQHATQEHEEIIDMLTNEPDYSGWGNWMYGFFYAPTLPNKNEKNKNGKVPLRTAIDRGNIGTTEILIKKGADPKITDEEGICPIFAVVQQNKPQLIPLLVKYQLIQQKKDGDNMLHYGIKHNQFAMVEKLAEDTNLTKEQNTHGKTPAMLAAEKTDITCLKILHEKGVNLNDRGSLGYQPIHSSAIAGSYETAKYLLEHGADVDSADNNENTPFLLAGAEGKKNVLDLLVAYKADTKKRNKQAKDILDLAVENKQHHIIERITKIPGININEQDALGRTPFMNAIMQKNHPAMEVLYQAGADIYITDYQGETALHKIARSGDCHALSQSFKTHEKQWNAANNDGNTAIFIAAESGHFNIITMLMHGGASLEGTNKNGETIFHQFAKSKKPLLFDAAIDQYKPRMDINARSKSGLSAIHYAVANDDVEMMKMFIQYGASYTDLTAHNDTLAHTAAESGALAILKELTYRMPMMLQQRNTHNHTPFLTATAYGNLDAVKFLLCENDFITRDVSVAINLAHQNNHTRLVRFLKEQEENRINACIALSNQPQAIINVEKDIHLLHQKITEKNAWHLLNVVFYESSVPKQYSVNELYYMTEAQRTHIALEYKKNYKNARNRQKQLQREFAQLKAQEKEQIRQENERIEKAQRAEERRQAAIAEQIRIQQAREHAAQQAAEKERIVKEQQKEFDYFAQQKQKEDAQKAQDAALKKCNEQKALADAVAAQQKMLDQGAANKALADAAQHAAALDKQQEHVPMNVQPSAPPMEQKNIVQQCVACGNKAPSKPLPCVKCKKKIESICAPCIKQHAGRCPECYKLHTLGIEKQKGECCIGVAACTEEKGVTVIPCTQCKKDSASDRICAGCLQACVNDNVKKGLLNKCPRCAQSTLNTELTEKILAQQK